MNIVTGSSVGTVVRALASHEMNVSWERFSDPACHMWVEFVVGSLLCSERIFSGYFGFPLSLKSKISKFQINPGMHRHF